MTVKQILDDKGSEVSTMSLNQTIAEAANFLVKHHIGAVVVSSERKKIAGILSERDIVRAISEKGKDVINKPISLIMTKNVKTCNSDNSIQEVMEIMTDGDFRHLPIVEGGNLLGIISIRDVIRHRIKEVEKEAEDIKAYIAAG